MKKVWISLVLLGLILMVFGSASVFAQKIPTQDILVPHIVGKTCTEAKNILDNLHLKVIVNEAFSKTVNEGMVISQSPASKIKVNASTPITIVVSKGKETVRAEILPSVLGKTVDEAKRILADLHLKIKVNDGFSDSVKKGSIIAQSPAPNTKVDINAVITIKISIGPKTVAVPYVVGKNYDEALRIFKMKNLIVEKTEDYSDTVAKNTVISQKPSAKTIMKSGSLIHVSISKGRKPVNKLLLFVAALLILILLGLVILILKEKTNLFASKRPGLSRKSRKAFGQIIPGNAQNIGSREQQQDAFGFSDLQNRSFIAGNGALAVLADGMGGMEMGREASNIAVRTALAEYALKPADEIIPDALTRIMKKSNQMVHEIAQQRNLVSRVGTTMLMVVIHRGQLFWASAGDSRIYLYRNGQVAQLTTDHVYARDLARMVSNNQISQEEADQHPERHALTSYLGLAELPIIDQNVNPITLLPGDKVLLCSDGLYNVLPIQELVECLREDAPIAADTLVKRTLSKNFYGQDNVTVAILQYE